MEALRKSVNELSEMVLNSIKLTVAATSAWIMGLPLAVKTLVLLIGIDYLTGVLAGFITKKLSSEVGAKGIAKKVMILLMCMVGHVLATVLSLDFDLGSAVAVFYTINEVISIIENCKRANLPTPKVLTDALEKYKTVTTTEQASSLETTVTDSAVTAVHKDSVTTTVVKEPLETVAKV